MKLRYKHLSAGYIGEKSHNQTLNSAYYSILFSNTELPDEFLGEIFIFPQRIPRLGFFEELYKLETTHFKSSFDAKKFDIQENLKKLANTAHKINPRHYINWVNIGLRYGIFLDFNNLPSFNSNDSSALEIALLKESGVNEHNLSNDIPVSIENYLNLADLYMKDQHVNIREKIILLNTLIVTFYRHQNDIAYKEKVDKYVGIFLELLTEFETSKILNLLYCSVGFRGLAMVSSFDTDQQLKFLNKAEHLASCIAGKSPIEEIVAKENQYTCFQSIAKWHLHKNEYQSAQVYLQKMIQIDPYDSTGHSELGFYYIKTESYELAAECFKKALDLGPPGAGMNAYYYAKCQEDLGNQTTAIEYFYESTELDDLTISPWLDLMNYYLNNKNIKGKDIAKYIYKKPTLFEQLDEDEINEIQNILN